MSITSKTPLIDFMRYGSRGGKNLKITKKMTAERDQNKNTPLHIAITVSDDGRSDEGWALEAVEELLENQCAIDEENSDGETALQLAAARGFSGIVARLLAAGAAPLHQDHLGISPLHCAKNANITTALLHSIPLAQRVDAVNLRDRRKRTPLHEAAYFGRINVARVLIKNNADYRLLEKHGKTAAQIAEAAITMREPARTGLSAIRIIHRQEREAARTNGQYQHILSLLRQQDHYRQNGIESTHPPRPSGRGRLLLFAITSIVWVPSLVILTLVTAGQWTWPLQQLRNTWRFIRPGTPPPHPLQYPEDSTTAPRQAIPPKPHRARGASQMIVADTAKIATKGSSQSIPPPIHSVPKH